jgi:hypothetical protein
MVDEHDAPTALPRHRRTHHPRRTGADHRDIEIFHGAKCSVFDLLERLSIVGLPLENR